MIIHTSVTMSALEHALVMISYMNLCSWMSVLMGKAKVNHMYHISHLASPHQEIIRINIAMDERFVVDVLDARN